MIHLVLINLWDNIVMLELLVLGKIPGTNVHIDIVFLLFAFLILATLAGCYYLLRNALTKALEASKKLLAIEFVSL